MILYLYAILSIKHLIFSDEIDGVFPETMEGNHMEGAMSLFQTELEILTGRGDLNLLIASATNKPHRLSQPMLQRYYNCITLIFKHVHK